MLRISHHTDWLLLVLLTGVVLALAARLYSPTRFKAFVQLPFHIRRRELEQNFNPAMGRGLFDVSLAFLSYLGLGLALYLLIHPPGPNFPLLSDWQLYLRLVFVLLLFFMVKNFLGLWVAWIFGRTDQVAHAQNVNLAYRAWLALVVLPFCALAVYWPPIYAVAHYLLWFLLVTGYLVALRFSFFQIWKMPVRSYYKIFYLCALEITPLLFLVGWLKSLYW